MKLKYVFVLFIFVVIAQLFVPAQMIFGQESILKNGKAFKFRTQPIDPSDPYRGKYVTLRYDINSALSNDSIWQRHQDVYVYLEADSLGFAKLVEVSKEPLVSENDFVIAQMNWHDKFNSKITFSLPFNRFYMEESKAQPAENAFRIAQTDSLPNNTYALVYIKDGEAVLEDVLINEISLADYVIENRDKL